MKITVKYFAMVRDVTGKTEDFLDFQKETTAQNMLSLLFDIYGKDFKRNICTSDGLLRDGLIFLLNGEVVNRNDLGSKMLKEGDVAAIMPPVGGG
ncbi:MoaD/ThiS family protein [Thermoproteota archaeon]